MSPAHYIKKTKQSIGQPVSGTKIDFHIMFQFVRNCFNKLKRAAAFGFFFALGSSRQKLYLFFLTSDMEQNSDKLNVIQATLNYWGKTLSDCLTISSAFSLTKARDTVSW